MKSTVWGSDMAEEYTLTVVASRPLSFFSIKRGDEVIHVYYKDLPFEIREGDVLIWNEVVASTSIDMGMMVVGE